MRVILPLLGFPIGCGSSPVADGEYVGVAKVALTETPADVSCVEVVATGTRQVIKRFGVVPGAAASLEVGGLPLGQVDFSARTFAERCADATPNALATWVSVSLTATILKHAITHVTLVLRRNGHISVGVDFQDCLAEFVDLGQLATSSSVALNASDMNNRGQVVGVTGAQAFIWSAGQIRALDTASSSYAFAINDAEEIAGMKGSRAVLWHNGVTEDIGDLGAGWSQPVALNEIGPVVGMSANASHQRRAFLWHSATGIVDLGTLGGSVTDVEALNAHGQIAGQSETANGEVHAFLWQSGLMRDLGTLGGIWSRAVGINGAGQVVGSSLTAQWTTHAFLWDSGTMRDLGHLGGDDSAALAINDAGLIVGRSKDSAAGYERVVVWDAGVLVDVGTFGGRESSSFGRRPINSAGDIVGRAETAFGTFRGFLWRDGVLHDIGTSPIASETQPRGINNSGQIFGVMLTSIGRHVRGFFLDEACPEPALSSGGQ